MYSIFGRAQFYLHFISKLGNVAQANEFEAQYLLDWFKIGVKFQIKNLHIKGDSSLMVEAIAWRERGNP